MLVYTVGGSIPLIYGLRSLYWSGFTSRIMRLLGRLDKSVIAFS